ncbi:hypothetical protein [Parafrankia discariae]|uniref:hypothetical protein n=1 Tax=Parafrankia discariae TaxID=365528 RepID=UPI000369A134|nr:hypothetical protein [Parafrankia discariae]
MPTPAGRVVVDPDALRRLITAMADLRETARAQARLLSAQADATGTATGTAGDAPAGLRAASAWADQGITVLRRRLALAEAADPGSAGPLPPAALRGVPDLYDTAEQARAAGRSLAERLLRPDPDRRDRSRLADLAAALSGRTADPDFVIGFYDRLGPSGLAGLLHQVLGAGTPGDPRPGVEIIGRTLASYSRLRRLDDAWLGRFNSRRRDDQVETALLGPLLRHGRFASSLLERLGELLFGTDDGSLRDVGLQTGPGGRGAGGSGAAREAFGSALLRAIATDPDLAPAFGTRHLSQLLHASWARSSDVPAGLRPTGGWRAPELEAARAELVAAAGGAAARLARPAAARQFVARLVDVVAGAGPSEVSPRMRAAYGEVLHTWREDLYAAVVSPLPPDPTALDTPGLGREPRQWAALLLESLRGGASAPLLAADAVAVGVDIDQRAWELTRGYNGPGAAHYPASPRALAYHQANEVTTFFGTALSETAERVLREHATREEEHRRRAAVMIDILAEVAKSIDFTSLVRTLTNAARGLTVEIVEDRIRRATADLPTAGSRAVLADLRTGLRAVPGWQSRYRASVADLWRHRGGDPLRPVLVQLPGGGTRRYTGDPRADGFVTGPADDFTGLDGEPMDVARMSREQRAAYAAWLASPAIVANNDRLPAVLTAPPADVVPGWAPDWAR